MAEGIYVYWGVGLFKGEAIRIEKKYQRQAIQEFYNIDTQYIFCLCIMTRELSVYHMAQNILRPCKRKQVFFEEYFLFEAAVDLNKCNNQIR